MHDQTTLPLVQRRANINSKSDIRMSARTVVILTSIDASPIFQQLCTSARRCGAAAAASMLYSVVRWLVWWWSVRWSVWWWSVGRPVRW